MRDSERYSLSPISPLPVQSRRRSLWPKILGAVVATIVLVAAVIYTPLFLDGDDPSNGALLTSSAVAQGINSTLLQDQEALADLYEQVLPSVVNIQVKTRGGSSISLLPGAQPEEDGPYSSGQGSGFIYDDNGHIVTNNHVVEDAFEVTVIFSNGYWADAEIVATDPQADLAVLKVTPPDGLEWRPLPLADVDDIRVGHMVIAIGNPFGLEGTMTRGIVSAMGRGLPVGELGSATYTLPEIIQTDAAINPGNSGGPLLNLNGEVVGVNFAIESPGRFNSGVGFTIPVDIVKKIVPKLIEEGGFEYAYLGVSGTSIEPDLARELELPGNVLGIYVNSVIAGGPSADAGLQGSTRTRTTAVGEVGIGGDIIVGIDDTPVRRFEDLVGYLVTETEPGKDVTLQVLRDGEAIDVTVTLGKRPGSTQFAAAQSAEVNAREAIAVALDAVEAEQIFDAEVGQKLATPGEVDGEEVWLVELTDENEKTVVVTVVKATGEVIGIEEE